MRNVQVLDTSPVTEEDRKQADLSYGHMKFSRTPVLINGAKPSSVKEKDGDNPENSSESNVTSTPASEASSLESTPKGSPRKSRKKHKSKEERGGRKKKSKESDEEVKEIGDAIRAMKPPSFAF